MRIESYEVLRGDACVGVEHGIPGKRDRARVIDVGA